MRVLKFEILSVIRFELIIYILFFKKKKINLNNSNNYIKIFVTLLIQYNTTL